MPQRPPPAAGLPTRSAKGISYRFVKLKYAHDPISGIGALKAPGRYHIEGRFRALYTSESPVAALSETAFLVRTNKGIAFRPAPPMVLFALEYDLERVLDLRVPAALKALGVQREQLFASWLRATPQNPSPTQAIAQAVHEAGVQGLFAPTAVPPHEATNFVVFPDNLDANGVSWVQVSDPEGSNTHRIP